LNDVTLPEMGEDEEAMLSEAFYVKANSWAIPITENLEGLELELAPEVKKKRELVLAFLCRVISFL
jgi:2Fe-2S ferredoxin